VAGAAAILGLIYLCGLNRNLLYLSILFSVAVMLATVLRRWWTISLALGICAFLAIVPAKVADLGKLYPAPHDIPGADKLWCTGIGAGETWLYHFTLDGLEKYRKGAGATGYLYIDGRNLSGLAVGVQGRTLKASAFSTEKTGMDHISIPLENVAEGALTVSLHGMPQATPMIFHGPEVHGHDVYGDAVWLEFTSGPDRVIYEAKRTVASSAPQ
jgi:hypothetical protein